MTIGVMNSKRKHIDIEPTNDAAFQCVALSGIISVDRVLGTNETKQKAHKHVCTYPNCNKTYRNPVKLQEHVDFKHLQVFNNVCDRVDENGKNCDFKCEQACHLKRHKDIKHDQLKEHKCSDCDIFFRSKKHRQDHWNAIHSALDDPCRTQFKCQVCSLGFLAKRDRNFHWTINCSPKDDPSRFKFRCSGCELGFPATCYRNDHELRNHSAKDDPKLIALHEKDRYRYANNPICRITSLARQAVRRVLDQQGSEKQEITEKLSGCSYDHLIVHLNNNDRGYFFEDDITHGKLQVDHVRPVSTVDASCYIDLLKICNWRNLQLLTQKENGRKSNKFTLADEAAYNACWRGVEIEAEAVKWRAECLCTCAKCV